MALSFIPRVLYSQVLVRIPPPTADFTGQTIVVSGSNCGLGIEAARHVAKLGASKIILAVRSVPKGEVAADDIARSTNITRSMLEIWQLDMSDSNSIKRFTEQVNGLERLDAVILNAGVMTTKWSELNGVESHLAVNVLGTILLSTLLMPKLEASASQTGLRGRLTIVGSDLMYIADHNQLITPGSIIDKLNDKTYASQVGDRYAISKLLIFYNIHELAKQHSLSTKHNVIVSVMTPGACESELFREPKPLAMRIASALLARSTEVGARTLVYAIDPALPVDAHGGFLMDNKVWSKSQFFDTSEKQELSRKWNAETRHYLESVVPVTSY